MGRRLQFELIVPWNVITLAQRADKLGTESSNNSLEAIWKSLPKNILCSRTNPSVTRHLRFSQLVDVDSSLLEGYTLLGRPYPVDGYVTFSETSVATNRHGVTSQNIWTAIICTVIPESITWLAATTKKRRRLIFTTSVARPTPGPAKPPILQVQELNTKEAWS